MNIRLLLALAVCGSAVAAPAHLALTPAQVQAAGIRLTPVTAASGSEGQPFSARVMPAPEAEWLITAPLGGVVTRLLVAEGDAVRAGQPLLQLRAPEAPALAATYQEAAGAARLADSERQRDRSLHADGIIPARRLQATEQQALAAEQARDAAAARLRLMGLTAGEAATGLIQLRAPAAAMVIARPAELGQRVSEADPLLRLADPKRLGIELQVPVSQADAFQIGRELTLVGAIGKARITQVGWGSGEQSQSVLVRARLQGAEGLRPGQWLRVRQQGAAKAVGNAWRVPASALLRQDRGHLVFVRRADGFSVVPVQVGGQHDGQAEVSGSLQAGDQVAASGLVTLKSLLAGGGD